jgi:hypothetical protein
MGLISLSLLADFAMDSFAAGGGVPGQLSFPPSFSSSDCLLPLQAGMRPSQGRGRGRGRSFQFVGTLPKNFRLLLLLDRIRLIFRRLHRWLLRLLVALCRLGVAVVCMTPTVDLVPTSHLEGRLPLEPAGGAVVPSDGGAFVSLDGFIFMFFD